MSGEARSVKTLNPTLLSYLKTLYEYNGAQMTPGGSWAAEDAASFLRRQGEEDIQKITPEPWSFGDFVKYMTSPVTNIVSPPHEHHEDLSWPLSSYFISSSHNTYLTGNQLYSDSSPDAYKNVLLRGCRCIEIDVWDGDDTDSETSVSSSDEDEPAKYEKRKKRVEKVKEKGPSGLVSRLERTSLGKKFTGKYVDKKKPEEKSVEGAPLEKKVSSGSGSSPLKSGVKKTNSILEPRVFHGYTLTKDILFRDVCTSIRDYGFVVTDTPLVVSLEVHCSPEHQQAMVDIMQEVWKGYLLPTPDEDVQSLPAPEELRGKILVKVKYAPPHKEGTVTPPSEEEAVVVAKDPKKDAAAAKPSKIIQALSKLGIYTRGVSFKSLTQPEATMPTHIFSLSENGVQEVHQKSARELFDHNKKYLMRAYPSGLRIGSSNLDPAPFWRKGIQIVALNWQKWDEGMMLNEGMFAGTGGYVLKPAGEFRFSYLSRIIFADTIPGYRSEKPSAPPPATNPQATAVKHYNMDLTIEVFTAQSLPLPIGDDDAKGFKPYLKVEVHVEEEGERHGSDLPADGKEKEGEYKAKTKSRRGCDPDFERQVLEFKQIPGVVPELSFVRFLVRDDEIGRDSLAAWACVRIDRLREGWRFIHLLDSDGMETESVILVKVSKKLLG